MAGRGAIAIAIRQRNAARDGITRIIDSIADDAVFFAFTVEQLEVKMRHLGRNWENLDAQHQELVGRVDDAEGMLEHEAYFIEIENAYLACEAKIAARIAALRNAVIDERPQPGVQREIVVRHRREPKVGQFDGRHENWQPFMDQFRVEVHDRDDLPSLEKLTILKTACVGKGAKALGSWPLTENNYLPAWQHLMDTYGDPYITKAKLIAEIFRMQRQNEETCDGLRTLIDTPKMALRQLADLGEQVHTWDLILVQTILFRAPPAVAEKFEGERRRNVEPTLENFHFFRFRYEMQ